MKTIRIRLLTVAVLVLTLTAALAAQDTNAPDPQPATIIGTVTDVNNSTVPGATVVLEGSGPSDRRTVVANDSGFFELRDLKAGVRYRITVSAKGFANWISPAIILRAGQAKILTGAKLRIAVARTTINVGYSSEQAATQQVRVQEQQRVFGIIPNFYVVYEPNPEPLTTKLKFQLALKVAVDPVTIGAIALFSGIDQAAGIPDYVQGAKGYGQRFGANAADATIDIMTSGAILPSLLHQDPRYFYQGTGTTMSRTLHALSSPFICKGDNGRLQPNYSSIGGDLATSAISRAYYPASDRTASQVFQSFAIDTGERMFADVVQEFVLRKFTKRKGQKK